jgi:hypothetical protein
MRATLGLLGWLLACGTNEPAGPAAGPAGAPQQPESTRSVAGPGDGDGCAELDRTACMASPRCTLQHAGTTDRRAYLCRPARAPCEIGFAQAGFFGSGDDIPAADRQQAQCNARPGCVFEPGGCYCPCRGNGHTTVPDSAGAPACQCDCGGGPPPVCRAR